MRKRNWRKILVLTLVFFFFAIPLSFVLWRGGNFYDHLDRFSFLVREQDAPRAKKELDYLRGFYGGAGRFRLQWLADRTLLRDAMLYEGEYIRLVGDYPGTERFLGDSKDYRAYRIRGIAWFRLAQATYQSGKSEEELKEAILNARNNFEQVLRRGPSDPFPDDQWNYDLVTDDEKLGKALATPRFVRIMLGSPSDEVLPGVGDEDGGIPGLPQDNRRAGESGRVRKKP